MARQLKLVRHGAKSDYGTDAYTAWPEGAICAGLTPPRTCIGR